MTHADDIEKEIDLNQFSCDVFKNFYHAWCNNGVKGELSERMTIHWDSCSSCMAWAYKKDAS